MKLYVGGLGLRGDGYPNSARTVRLLEQQADIEIVHCERWLPVDLHLWKLARMPRWRALRWLLVLALGNLRSLLRVRARVRKEDAPVFVPYPGMFFLFWLSLFPRGRRMRCIVDSYISVWDSMVRDRADGNSRSVGSRLLKWFEARALRTAEMVLVDTEANRDDFIAEFGLDPERIRSIPLAIAEEPFVATRERARQPNSRIRVLFVGTLIPLHGISVLLDAFAQLANDQRFEFRLIGSGQEANHVSEFIAAYPRLRWSGYANGARLIGSRARSAMPISASVFSVAKARRHACFHSSCTCISPAARR